MATNEILGSERGRAVVRRWTADGATLPDTRRRTSHSSTPSGCHIAEVATGASAIHYSRIYHLTDPKAVAVCVVAPTPPSTVAAGRNRFRACLSRAPKRFSEGVTVDAFQNTTAIGEGEGRYIVLSSPADIQSQEGGKLRVPISVVSCYENKKQEFTILLSTLNKLIEKKKETVLVLYQKFDSSTGFV
ncbi:hypothetical protein AAG570_005527 [Ranatra chinensis]|uniref:Uncharacterized protein n=1 Tax=Ranatra chinensis TaxID=642074 RepID=A0ABD0XXN9_9HEMI